MDDWKDWFELMTKAFRAVTAFVKLVRVILPRKTKR